MSFQTSEYESVNGPTTNGTATAPTREPTSSNGPQITKRYVWVDLPQDEYPGFKARIWVNAPQQVWREVAGVKSEAGVMAALAQLVIEHNGWRDFDGEAYPSPTDLGERCTAEHAEGEDCPGLIRPGFWDLIPNELLSVLTVTVQQQMGKLATSLVPTTRRR